MASAGLYLIHSPREESWAARVEAHLERVHPVTTWSLGAEPAPELKGDSGAPLLAVLLVSRHLLESIEFRFEIRRLRTLASNERLQTLVLLVEPCSELARSVLGDLPCRTLVGISDNSSAAEVERVLTLLAREVAERLGAAELPSEPGVDELFDQIYTQNYPTLVAFFGRRRLDPETSRDLAQATMLRAYRGLDSFESRASTRSWVLRIATHVWCNWVRDHRRTIKRGANETSLERVREKGLQLSEDQGFWPFTNKDPERAALERQAQERIRDRISQLSARQQDCLNLWLEGWSYQEMADEMGVSIQTIRASLHKARSRITRELGQEFRPSTYATTGASS